MSQINLNFSGHPSTTHFSINRDSVHNIEPNQSQESVQRIGTNQKQVLNSIQPQGSPENRQLILPYKKSILKPIVQSIPELRKKSTLSKLKQHPKTSTRNINVTATNQSKKIRPEQTCLESSLLKNKYLKSIFDHFCDISLANVKNKTFEQMEAKYQAMPLSRFMLFCKQFDIYSFVKYQLKVENSPTSTSISRANTFHKGPEQLMESNASQYLSKAGKTKMLEIPVKEIFNFQKKMISMFRKYVEDNQKMSFQKFVQAIKQIYEIFARNLKQICPKKSLPNETSVWKQFLQNVLCITSKDSFQDKMDSLKIGFVGSISYHPEASVNRKSQKYFQKPLVMHGGRSPEEMKKELEIYQSTKFKKTQNWIGSQPQNVAIYSKSRIFYKPTPTKTYETNDVIKLARREAGRIHTQSLFDVNQVKQKGERKTYISKKQGETVTFSKIFQDRTNNLVNKFQKLKDEFEVKKSGKSRIKETQNDDEILQKYFENEKKTYGSETVRIKSIN